MPKDRSLTIRLDVEDLDALEIIAQAERSSTSAIARRAIVRELERHKDVLENAEKPERGTRKGRKGRER